MDTLKIDKHVKYISTMHSKSSQKKSARNRSKDLIVVVVVVMARFGQTEAFE